MQIDKLVKEAIINHKHKIELTQWSIISSIASLIYSDYIKRMKQKEFPVKAILVPSLKSVRRLLDINGLFIHMLSENLMDDIAKNELFEKYNTAPEFIMFNDDNIEVMKAIFDLYIVPNIIRRIPETIDKKFAISDDSQQLFREDRDIEVFDGISNYQYKYIVQEIVLQLLALIPTMKKNIDIPENNTQIFMAEDEVLMITNSNAICPIYFDVDVIGSPVSELLQFVTSTSFKRIDIGKNVRVKGDKIVQYSVDTGVSNEVALISFEGISMN